jgi:hypothetical protein
MLEEDGLENMDGEQFDLTTGPNKAYATDRINLALDCKNYKTLLLGKDNKMYVSPPTDSKATTNDEYSNGNWLVFHPIHGKKVATVPININNVMKLVWTTETKTKHHPKLFDMAHYGSIISEDQYFDKLDFGVEQLMRKTPITPYEKISVKQLIRHLPPTDNSIGENFDSNMKNLCGLDVMNHVQDLALFTKYSFKELKIHISEIIGCDQKEITTVGITPNQLIQWFNKYVSSKAKISLQIIDQTNVSKVIHLVRITLEIMIIIAKTQLL